MRFYSVKHFEKILDDPQGVTPGDLIQCHKIIGWEHKAKRCGKKNLAILESLVAEIETTGAISEQTTQAARAIITRLLDIAAKRSKHAADNYADYLEFEAAEFNKMIFGEDDL